jgi:hypothetical protein
LPGKLDQSGESTGWNFTERVLRDEETLFSSSGSGGWADRKQVLYEPAQLTEAIRKALAAPRSQTVRVSIQLTRTR